MKVALVDECSVLLLKRGFIVKNLKRSCFDILARHEDKILLIKVLEDANAVSREYSDEMLLISSYFGAAPLIIAEKAKENLLDNVLYSRFGIFTLNMATFTSCIINKHPFVRRNKAGLIVSLSGKKLRNVRQAEGYSLSYLAKRLGVSSRMVSKYENENSEVTIQKALKVYDLFGDCVFEKIDVFSTPTCDRVTGKSMVSRKYSDLGFKASDMHKTPFDVIAKKEHELILTEIGDKRHDHLRPISQLLDAEKLVIFKKKKPKDLPGLTKGEFLEMEKANELLKFLKEF